MTAPTFAATQYDFSKLFLLAGQVFSSLRNSIVFARLCEAEWNDRGSIDAAALARISKLANVD